MPRTRSLAWSELKIGITALAAVVLAILLISAVGGQAGFSWQQFQLFTVFANVQGLKAGAVVRLAGVEVGTVADIEFAGSDVKVTMDINEDVQRRITTQSRASLGSLSLLGEPLVEISAASNGTPLEDGAFIPSLPASAGLADVTAGAAQSLEQLTGLLGDVRAGEGTVGRLFTEDELYRELRGVVDAAGDVADRIRQGRGTVGQLVRDPALYRNLNAAVDNLQQITRMLARGDGSLGRLLSDEAFATALIGAATNLRELTAAVQRGQGTLGQLVNDPSLYNRLDEVTARLDAIAASVQHGEGTIGRLVQDPELYANVNAAARELRALIRDIRKDPRKYLNVRVSVF